MSAHLVQFVKERAADAGAAVATGAAVTTPIAVALADIEIYFRIGGYVFGMISAVFAARYYWKKSK